MSEGRRRLAAIMFTDMVGYSALVQADEAAALAALAEHNALVRRVLGEFSGREVKTAGDSFLIEFDSALDAVRCAVEIQRSLGARNAGLPEPRRIRVRIGVHVGDVVQTGGDVLGDAVNVASRIEALADPGGICLTQQVVDQVQNRLPQPLLRLPPASLKNIRLPVTVYKVLGLESTVRPSAGGRGDGEVRHLAVLPFTNISPDPNDAYFADGLTEEVISVLSQVRGLDVIARTSVTPYKLAPKPVAQVGAELGVDLVLEGSVRKAGNRIRITLQLVDAVTQGHLWASSYNRELTDVFEVQSDIAERTAQALQLEFAKGRARGGDHRPTPDLEAYDEYLRGLVWAFAPEGSGVDEAVRCFERATTRDPQFAEAFAAWANLYVSMAGDFLPMAEVMPRARELAARALELDPNCSEAHSTLGNIAFQFDQDWSTSEAEFRRAIALNPSNVTAYQFFGMMLMALQRLDEAREAINRAVRLDPGGNERWSLAYLEILAGHWDLAEAVARAELIADPSSMKGHIYLGLYAARAGRWDVARAQAAVPWTGRSEDQRFDHALLNALVGHPEEGRTIIAEAERGEPRSYTSLTHLAIMYAALGDAPKSLDLLERAYREGDRVLWLFYPGVWFDPLRHDPRFVALLQRYGVPRWEPHGGQPSGPSGS